MKDKQQKQYTKEFKQGAVRLVTEQGRKINDVAESLGVSPWSISRWIKAEGHEGADAFRGNGTRTAHEQEIFELKQKIRQLEEERAILKKAAAYFAAHIV
jgi:transposase